MDRGEDKQHRNQRCQPFAGLSLGFSEGVGQWTNGSKILALFQFFNSIDFSMKGA